MEISGRELQKELLSDLRQELAELKKQNITPCIAIVTLGPEETWEAYVKQKLKLAGNLEIESRLINLKPKSTEDVIELVEELNGDKSVHGLIVQRPFPNHIDTERVTQNISKDKDIDGFIKSSEFEVPAWLAVKHILIHISTLLNDSDLPNFLLNRSILVVGKGGTAGQPVINGLIEMGISPQVIDSKTQNRTELFSKADITISAVGKTDIIPVDELKNKSILIGIGTHVEDGRLQGDFDQSEAEKKGLYYTPTPGGVGPVNLAYLFQNLIKAVKKNTKA